jgi:hypothetical protein
MHGRHEMLLVVIGKKIHFLLSPPLSSSSSHELARFESTHLQGFLLLEQSLKQRFQLLI